MNSLPIRVLTVELVGFSLTDMKRAVFVGMAKERRHA